MNNISYIPHSKPYITKQDNLALSKILSSGMLEEGDEKRKFEDNFSTYIGSKRAFATSSGKMALELALKAIGVEGGEVIQPFYVCDDVKWAIHRAGAKSIFCDIGEGWNVTLEHIEKNISPSTKAIVVVHTFGIIFDIERLKKFGIPIIEDFCQALVPNLNRHQDDSISIFSFHPTKCISGGSGGAITTNNEKWIRFIDENLDDYKAFVSNDLTWTLVNSQLSQYSNFLSIRKDLAKKYIHELPSIFTDYILDYEKSIGVWFRFVLDISNKKYEFEEVKKQFKLHKIDVRRPVELNISKSEVLSFPESSKRLKQSLSIPLYPALTSDDQERIIKAANQILRF